MGTRQFNNNQFTLDENLYNDITEIYEKDKQVFKPFKIVLRKGSETIASRKYYLFKCESDHLSMTTSGYNNLVNPEDTDKVYFVHDV